MNFNTHEFLSYSNWKSVQRKHGINTQNYRLNEDNARMSVLLLLNQTKQNMFIWFVLVEWLLLLPLHWAAFAAAAAARFNCWVICVSSFTNAATVERLDNRVLLLCVCVSLSVCVHMYVVLLTLSSLFLTDSHWLVVVAVAAVIFSVFYTNTII